MEHTGSNGRQQLKDETLQPRPGHTAGPLPLQPHSLHFVLGVGFAPATLHLCRVQQGMLPDGVGPIAGKRVHHLWGRDAKRERVSAACWPLGEILPKRLLQLEPPPRAYNVPDIQSGHPKCSTSCQLTLVGLPRFRMFKQLAQYTVQAADLGRCIL